MCQVTYIYFAVKSQLCGQDIILFERDIKLFRQDFIVTIMLFEQDNKLCK